MTNEIPSPNHSGLPKAKGYVSAGETHPDILPVLEMEMRKICRAVEATGTEVYIGATFELKKDEEGGNMFSIISISESGEKKVIEGLDHQSPMDMGARIRHIGQMAQTMKGPEVTLEQLVASFENK